jgi:hypothetical protein
MFSEIVCISVFAFSNDVFDDAKIPTALFDMLSACSNITSLELCTSAMYLPTFLVFSSM